MFEGQVTFGGSVSLIVTENEHDGPAVVVQFTVVAPTEKNEPDAGVHVTVPQEPVVEGAGYETTAPHEPVVFDWMIFDGQVIVHVPAAFTVIVKLHVPIFDALSETLQLTVVVPRTKLDPDGGTQVGVPTPGQLSLTVRAEYVTVALPEPDGFSVVIIFEGQVIDGCSKSLMVTEKLHVGPAVVEQFTVVDPTAKNDPDAGTHVTVPQVPTVDGAEYDTFAPHCPVVFNCVMFDGQVMVHELGGSTFAHQVPHRPEPFPEPTLGSANS